MSIDLQWQLRNIQRLRVTLTPSYSVRAPRLSGVCASVKPGWSGRMDSSERGRCDDDFDRLELDLDRARLESCPWDMYPQFLYESPAQEMFAGSWNKH